MKGRQALTEFIDAILDPQNLDGRHIILRGVDEESGGKGYTLRFINSTEGAEFARVFNSHVEYSKKPPCIEGDDDDNY